MTSTPNKDTEFIEVDIGSSQYITGVQILSVQTCPITIPSCLDRMKGVRVEVNETTSPEALAVYSTTKGSISVSAPVASAAISVVSSANDVPITRVDPSLPVSYVRHWNKVNRSYTYHSGNEISTTHPQLPSNRIYSGVVPRPDGIPQPTRDDEKRILGLSGGASVMEQKGGFSPLPVDIPILSDSTIVEPWAKYFDTSIRKYFYINTQTAEEKWEHPVTPKQVGTSDTAVDDKSIPQGWSKYLDTSTDTYFYYDSNTTETCWDNPSPPQFPQGLTIIDSELPDLYVKYSEPTSSIPEHSFFFNTLTTETFWYLPQSKLLDKLKAKRKAITDSTSSEATDSTNSEATDSTSPEQSGSTNPEQSGSTTPEESGSSEASGTQSGGLRKKRTQKKKQKTNASKKNLGKY
jgi:hypothetical protein